MFNLVHICWFFLENILLFLEGHLKLRLKHIFYGLVSFLELAFLNEKKGCAKGFRDYSEKDTHKHLFVDLCVSFVG